MSNNDEYTRKDTETNTEKERIAIDRIRYSGLVFSMQIKKIIIKQNSRLLGCRILCARALDSIPDSVNMIN